MMFESKEKFISLANMNKKERKKDFCNLEQPSPPPPIIMKRRFAHFPSQSRWIQAGGHINVTADVTLPQLEYFCSRQSSSQKLLEKYRLGKNIFFKCISILLSKVGKTIAPRL